MELKEENTKKRSNEDIASDVEPPRIFLDYIIDEKWARRDLLLPTSMSLVDV